MTTARLHLLRRGVDLLMSVVVVVVVGMVLFGALIGLTGHQSFIIAGGSMEPAIHTGSIAVVSPVAPETIVVGDIVTIRGDNNVVVTHRVAKVGSEDGTPVFELKGDANATPDGATVPARAVIGRLLIAIPFIGYLSAYLSTPSGLIAAFAALGLLFLLHHLLESAEAERRSAEAAVATSPTVNLPEGL